MRGIQSSHYPRKIRVVTTGGKTQRLLSVPKIVAELFEDDDVFTCEVREGGIFFKRISVRKETDAA